MDLARQEHPLVWQQYMPVPFTNPFLLTFVRGASREPVDGLGQAALSFIVPFVTSWMGHLEAPPANPEKTELPFSPSLVTAS